MSAEKQIPLPRPTPISQPYWGACKEGRLTVQRCKDCGAYTFIPQPCCGECLSEDYEWADSSGRGTLYSFSTVYRPQQPVFETERLRIADHKFEWSNWSIFGRNHLKFLTSRQTIINCPLLCQ